MTLNIIPVNIVAQCIIDEIHEESNEEIKIQQICAPINSQWNINVNHMLTMLKTLLPSSQSLDIVNMDSDDFGKYLEARWGYSVYLPWERNNMESQKTANANIAEFADSPQFISNVPSEYFPIMADETIYEQICLYVARSIHQYKLEHALQRPKQDYFFTSILPDQIIDITIQLQEPIEFQSEKEAMMRVYDCVSAYRPFFCLPDQKTLQYTIKQAPSITWNPMESSSSCNIQLIGSYKYVTGLKVRVHHGIGDGISLIGLIPRVLSMADNYPRQSIMTPSAKPRSLTFEQEIRCLVYYLCILIRLWYEPVAKRNVYPITIEQRTHLFHKITGKSFTTSIIEKSFPILRSALNKDTVVYSIPAMIKSPKDRALDIQKNFFVPIILPWSASGGNIQEMCLHSKAVKFVAWLLCQAIAHTGSGWLIKSGIEKTDVIMSSLIASDRPLPNIKSVHFMIPMASDAPVTVGLMTIGKETHVTVTSTMHQTTAKQIMDEMTGSK